MVEGYWRLVPVGPDRREVYDKVAASVPTTDLLQSYEWGEVKARTGWRPLPFLLLDPSGATRGASLILKRAAPLGRSIFYCPRGPAIDFHDQEAFGQWVRLVRREAAAHLAILVKIDPPIPMDKRKGRLAMGDATALLFRGAGFRLLRTGPNFEGVQPKFVYKLDLDRSLDDVMASFIPKTRYNIRLAERKGVQVRPAGRGDLSTWYDILLETAVRDRFRVRSFSYFESLWDLLVERGLARLFLAEYEGRIIAGTLAFVFGKQCWYIYGASSNQDRNVMPNYALQWAMITWAKEQGCTIYDFRGVSGDLTPDNPLYGLYRFKRGFSGRLVEYVGEFDLPLEPLFYLAWVRGLPAYRHWRGRILGSGGARGKGRGAGQGAGGVAGPKEEPVGDSGAGEGE